MPLSRCAGLLGLVLLACAPFLPGAASGEPRIETLGTLPPALAESSAVAVSRAQPDVFWTLNDSGNGPRLFALAPDGAVRGIYTVRDARNVDWEDVALGRCPKSGAWCLFVADTGDNLESRADVTIYVVPEPVLPAPSATPEPVRPASPQNALRVRYADGPHDVEAIAFDPDGDLLLISKGQRSSIHVYRVPRAALGGTSAHAELLDVDTIAPRGLVGAWVTGAATSPDGVRLVVRTYTELYFFRFAPDGKLVSDAAPCPLGFVEPQGEGVDFLDATSLVLTSESRGGRRGQILRVTCAR